MKGIARRGPSSGGATGMAQAAVSVDGLPEDLTHNPFWTLMRPFMKSWTRVFQAPHVTAVRVQLELPNQQAYDLTVKYWPEDRISLCSDKVAAVGRATMILDHELLLPELSSCRVKYQGLLSISRYGGTSLEDLLNSPEFLDSMPNVEKREKFLKQLVVHLLVALEHLRFKHNDGGGPQSYRDITPSNIVIDLGTMKASLIDFGSIMEKDWVNFFHEISRDQFPVDYAAMNPDTGKPYCCDDLSGYKKAALAVAASTTGSIDSNMVGLTALRVLSAFTPDRNQLVPVQWKDYQPTVKEKAHLSADQLQQLEQSRLAAFAEAYWSFMSDRKALRQLLTMTGISDGAVEFLLPLLEVNPMKRPSIWAARLHPWLKSSRREIGGQVEENRNEYEAEQVRLQLLPLALQQALAELLSQQQQQQMQRKQQLQQEQQFSKIHQALEDAEMALKSKQRHNEELEEQVSMLKDELLETTTEARDQQAELWQLIQHQVQDNELLEQQLLSQQQLNQQLQQDKDAVIAQLQQQIRRGEGGDAPQQQRVPVGDQHHQVAVEAGAEALPYREDTAVVVDEQPVIICNGVLFAMEHDTIDRRCTNSSIGGSSSSDFSVPHTPMCSSGGIHPTGNSSLSASASHPGAQTHHSSPALSGNPAARAPAVTSHMTVNNAACDDKSTCCRLMQQLIFFVVNIISWGIIIGGAMLSATCWVVNKWVSLIGGAIWGAICYVVNKWVSLIGGAIWGAICYVVNTWVSLIGGSIWGAVCWVVEMWASFIGGAIWRATRWVVGSWVNLVGSSIKTTMSWIVAS